MNVLRQLEHRHSQAQRAVEGIEHFDLQHSAALLRDDPGQIERAGKPAGQHDRNNAVIALGHDLPERFSDVLPRGQRSLGQLTRLKPPVNIRGADIHAVQILAVGAEYPEGHHKNVIFSRQLGRNIRAGIC